MLANPRVLPFSLGMESQEGMQIPEVPVSFQCFSEGRRTTQPFPDEGENFPVRLKKNAAVVMASYEVIDIIVLEL